VWVTVTLGYHRDEWVLLVKALGVIRDIQHLEFTCIPGSRGFHSFQAVAEAVNSAQSLRKLRVGTVGTTFPRYPSGLTALANALREHTALQEFIWGDLYSRTEAAQITSIDLVLWALPAGPHLRNVIIMTKYASADAMKNLLQLPSAAHFVGHRQPQVGFLAMHQGTTSDATEAVKAAASAIRLDQNLKHLTLVVEEGFTDEACVALAEALTVNITLCKIILPRASTLGVQAYEAISAMLRVNTSLNLKLPPLETVGASARLLEYRNQIRIEQRLNKVGRGRLLSSSIQTTREEYVDALHELSPKGVNDPSAFRLSCVFSLLRLNPSVVSMS
jgi:hypothetical protein